MRIFVILFVLALFATLSFAQQPDCDYKVEVLLDSYEFSKDNFTWRMKATKIEGIATNITGTAKIESSNGIAKSYKPWTNSSISRQKTSNTYSPNLDEGSYKITAEITVECNDLDENDNIDAKTFEIIEQNVEEEVIEKQQVQLNQEIVAVNETKNNVINDETMNYEKTINDENLQQNQIQEQKIETQIDEGFDNVINLKENVEEEDNPAIIYKSSNEMTKELTLYFILGLSILLNIILIWRR